MILTGRLLPATLLLLLVKGLLIGGVVGGYCWLVSPLLMVRSTAVHTLVFVLWCVVLMPAVYAVWRWDHV